MMNRHVSLRRLLKLMCRGGFCLGVFVLGGGAIFGDIDAQKKGAGVRLATNPRGERRVALVIGNSNYEPEIGRLKNPVNDASDIAAALQGLEFELIGGKAHLDVNLRQMDDLVRTFGREIRRGGVGVFYFSGHGMQVNRLNYLLPLGARVEKDQDLPFEAFDVDRILAEMEAAENKLNILILDACRNNPLMRSLRSGGKGLARPESVPIGTYVAFAAKDGQVASDNAAGRNGLYTQELLKNIGQPGLRLEDIFINTRREVRRLSHNAQIPVEYGSIDAPFFFFIEEGNSTELGNIPASPAMTTPGAASTFLSSYRRWLTLLDRSDYATVAREANAELSRNPNNGLALRARSSTYYLRNEMEKGKRDSEAAAQSLANARSAEEYEARCYVNWRLEKLDEAVSDCTRAIDLDPRLNRAYHHRGNVYGNKREYDRAIADFTRAIELDPKSALAYNNRGLAYYYKQDYDRAITEFTKAIELAPKYARAYNNRGLAYSDKQEYGFGIADFSRAIELDSKFALAYENRSKAHDAKGDRVRAAADRQKATELEKQQP